MENTSITDSCPKPESSYPMLLSHKGNSTAEESSAKNMASVHRPKNTTPAK